MGQKKLQRFAEIKTFSNVLEYPEGASGNWKAHFDNTNPIVLELACGKGEYTVGLGAKHANKNYIGVDIKGNRIWVGAKRALEQGLKNVAFLRTQIEKLTDYFVPAEVHEIWITFPDPQLKIARAKKRLTHPRFLRLYQAILDKGGMVHLKTDSPDLYRFTLLVTQLYNLTIIKNIDDVYASTEAGDDLYIKTHYEKLDIARSNRIHYLCFLLDQPLPSAKDDQLKQLLTDAEEAE